MPTPVPLPENPDLEQLRRQARDLSRASRAGDTAALDEVATYAPEHGPGPAPLHVAQLVVARRYGFPGWPPLVRHLETVARFSWVPDDSAIASPADEFLALACLRYGDDDPARRDRAAALLVDRPDIAGSSVHTAAATADVAALRRLVPGAANLDGGPNGWPPLMYLAYARHDAGIDQDAVVAAATLLLDAGADPNAGRLWRGLPCPFTVLTGVFGEGEQGPRALPRHPAQTPLAGLLLERGADPNDGQALYNRMFGTDDSHLVLLFAHGLGRGDGGVWQARLGVALDRPDRMLAAQLEWGVMHDMRDRVRLLLDNGVPADVALRHGRPAAEVAAGLGNRELVELLVGRGAVRPALDDADAVVAAAFAGDGDAVRSAPAAVAARVRTAHPGALVWAAANGRPEAVVLLLELGFDVNTLARGDIPSGQPWSTALHEAAHRGDGDMVALLLDRGADATLRDARFDATAGGWAAHGGHPDLAALLDGHTTR